MNRLRYPRKFTLISLLFAASLGLTLYLWRAEVRRELDGVRSAAHALKGIAANLGLLAEAYAGLRRLAV